ncbi:MAG: P-type conjugative transfer protein VirB9 [Pseudomonadota bacterium]
MNRKRLVILGLLFLSATMVPALAEKIPQAGTADARVKLVAWHDNDVYRLKGHYGFTTIVEFSPKEKIETVSLGDSEAWQVVKPNRQNVLFVKPLEQNADTNMTVLTSQRIYTFQLSAEKADTPDSADLTFRLRFTYPENAGGGVLNFSSAAETVESTQNTASVKDMNFNYSYSGSKFLQPERVFDDDKFTYFQFDAIDVTPAIFSVDEKGNESLVNFTMQGDTLVVERTARQFTLRDGDISTCIFNEAYSRPAGRESAVVPVGKIREKKTASITAKKSRTAKHDIPDPPMLDFFKNFHVDTTTADASSYNP